MARLRSVPDHRHHRRQLRAAAAPVTAEASVESAPAASTGSGNYVVKAGDTLSKIAAAHGISLENLASQVPNINLIFPGQSLSV